MITSPVRINRIATRFLFRMVSCILLLASTCADASSDDRLIFLGNRNIPPVVYLDEGIPSGVVVDLVRAVSRHIPKPVEIRAVDWTEAQRQVLEGKADALIQINKTPEREKVYDFSEPLLESQFTIFTGSDRVGISGLSDLKGLRVGVEAAGLPRQVLEKIPEIRLDIIPNFLEGFKRIKDGAIDAVVVDFRVGSYIVAENKLRNIKAVGKPIAYSYSAIAVKKGNSELLASINRGLSRIKADGTYDEIIKKWRPAEVVFATREQIARMKYTALVVVLLTLLLIAAVWTFTVKKELSKRRAAEEKLVSEENRYRALFEDSPISLWEEDFSRVKKRLDELRSLGVTDFRRYFQQHPDEVIRCAVSTKVIAVNQATLSLFKADGKEHLLAGLEQIFCDESFVVFTEELITLSEGSTRFYSEAIQKNLRGEKFHTAVTLSVAPGHEKSWARVLVSVTDITDRKRAEEALKASEARFRRLAENARDVIYRMSLPDCSYEYISPAVNDIFGYSPEEFYTTPGLFRRIIHPEWAGYFEEEMSKLLRGEMPPVYEYQFLHKSGEPRWANQRNILVRDEDGTIVAIEGIVTDVTLMKQSEEALRALNKELQDFNAELEQRVKERTVELEEKNQELEKANRIFVGRELRMIELKEKIRELEQILPH